MGRVRRPGRRGPDDRAAARPAAPRRGVCPATAAPGDRDPVMAPARLAPARLAPAWAAAAWVLAAPLHGASAQAIAPSVLPGLGPDAARVSVDVARMPWRAVVRVQTETGGRCTGALIGPRAVLTAAHCLLGRATGRPVQPRSVHVLSGYDRGGFDGHARAVSFTAGPGFVDAPASAPPGADWAVLTLDAPLGAPDRVLPLLHRAHRARR